LGNITGGPVEEPPVPRHGSLDEAKSAMDTLPFVALKFMATEYREVFEL